MHRYMTISPEEIKIIMWLFADKISCSYCPLVERCANDDILRYRIGRNCEQLLFNYLLEEEQNE